MPHIKINGIGTTRQYEVGIRKIQSHEKNGGRSHLATGHETESGYGV